MDFGQKLIRLRKKQGLSQEELGRRLDVSRQTVSKWEAGASYPDFERLILLADFFDISLDELARDGHKPDGQSAENIQLPADVYLKGKKVISSSVKFLSIFGWVMLGLMAARAVLAVVRGI